MSRYIAGTEHVPCVGIARSTPVLIAHRGAADDAPENTLAAFKLAWQQGADGIEGDFRLTRDGEIVCIHDADTQRTAGQATKVAEATFAELCWLDVGSWKGDPWRGVRIPSLGEVLATVPAGTRVCIEIKCGPEILPALKAALAGSGLQSGQTIVMSFDPNVIAEAKRLLPQRKALWLTDFKADPETGVGPTATEILQTLEKTAPTASAAERTRSSIKRSCRRCGRRKRRYTSGRWTMCPPRNGICNLARIPSPRIVPAG